VVRASLCWTRRGSGTRNGTAAESTWNPGGTPEFGKWSGRLDSNQRPPAPKGYVLRLSTTSCKTEVQVVDSPMNLAL
jgi:hypothetical protein